MVGRPGIFLVLLLLLAMPAFAAEPEITDQHRLATLAGYMLNLSDLHGRDLTMECGPKEEVLYLRPEALQGDYYCVMNSSLGVIFGTFVPIDPPQERQGLLGTYNSSLYRSPQQAVEVSRTACDSRGIGSFSPCPGALRYVLNKDSNPQVRPLYTYVEQDEGVLGGTGALYIVVSENLLPSIEGQRSIFADIIDLFRGLFRWLS